MTRVLIALSALFAIAACSNSGGGNNSNSTGGNATNGSGSATGGAYTFVAADTSDAGMQELPIAMAVGPQDQVGVAYFRPTGTFSLAMGDAGQRENYGVMYLEVKGGAVTRPPSQIAVVQNQDGITVNFDSQGDPVVGFLGGGSYFYDGGFPADAGVDSTGSLYWLQSQPALAYGQTDGGWSLQVCMQDSTAMGAFTWTVDTGDGMSDQSAMQVINEGNVVGLWPTLVFDGGTTIMAYRDVHFGQFPKQDWGPANVKLCQGTPGNWSSWSAPVTIDAAGGHEDGYGVHNQMIVGKNGALALVGDTNANGQGSVDSDSTNAWFVQQNLGSWTLSTLDWSLPINPFNPKNNTAEALVDTQTGPQMAYNSTFGYSVVVVDTAPPMGGGAPALYYVSSQDGKTWSSRETVFSLGSGGFYPAIADDPVTGNPNIVYTICSGDPGILPAPLNCPPSSSRLDVVVVGANPPNWTANTTVITTQAVFMPKIGFLSTDKIAIAYRDLNTGAVYVALQN